LGPQFNENGALPLTVLEQLVDEWLARCRIDRRAN
jgi:hypothetical protein